MEERVELSILLDYYGVLFTEKQKDIMELYYNQDLSLVEIAEINNTSRQAIFDVIKKCHIQLLAYEKLLNLHSISKNIELKKQSLIEKLKLVKNKNTDLELQELIEDIIGDVLELG